VAEWKSELRAEPAIARLVLRRLVGPLVFHDDTDRSDFVKWEAARMERALLTGLAQAGGLEGSSPTGFEPTGTSNPDGFLTRQVYRVSIAAA
jgi:hypothetical protein